MRKLSDFDYSYLSDLLWVFIDLLDDVRQDEFTDQERLAELRESIARLWDEFAFQMFTIIDDTGAFHLNKSMAVTTAIRLKRFLRLFEANRIDILRLLMIWKEDQYWATDYDDILGLSPKQHHEAQSRITDWLNGTIKEMEVFGK